MSTELLGPHVCNIISSFAQTWKLDCVSWKCTCEIDIHSLIHGLQHKGHTEGCGCGWVCVCVFGGRGCCWWWGVVYPSWHWVTAGYTLVMAPVHLRADCQLDKSSSIPILNENNNPTSQSWQHAAVLVRYQNDNQGGKNAYKILLKKASKHGHVLDPHVASEEWRICLWLTDLYLVHKLQVLHQHLEYSPVRHSF